MADAGPTIEDIEGFVAGLEAAAQVQDPLLLQEDLVYPGTSTIRPFDQYVGIDPNFGEFAETAYRWLRIQHACGNTRNAIARIGPTKPGIMDYVTEGMMPHELEKKRRRTLVLCPEENQAFPGRITSVTQFWANDGAMKRLAESTPRPGTTADIPQTYAAMLPHVRQMADALVDRSVEIDNDGSKQVKLVKSTSGTVYEHEAWKIMFIAIDAQKGNPGAYPWATSLYWRRYDSFSARWNDLVIFVRASTGAVANLLMCPHANRFASDPASELDRKRINKKGNLEKTAKKTATEAALAQLEAVMANNPGSNNNTGNNTTIQLANNHDDDDNYEDGGDDDSEIRVSGRVLNGVVNELDEEEEATDEEAADVVDANDGPNDEDSDDIHGLGGRIESREFIAETDSGHALPMHPMAAAVAAGHSL
ncbi:hypothetical protein B0T13DRAFT_509012 [Neurospora crassa]|nr:hypothetical protein B0T13DRAFT_509012 [Neurospora crassa]